jgi:hypothetical protein
MHDARDTGHTCPDTTAPPSRRRLLTGSAATLLAGAAAIATARATQRLKAEAAYVAIADVSVDDCWTNGMHREELAALSVLRDLTGRAAA